MNQTSPESVEKTTTNQPKDDTTVNYSTFTKYQKRYMLALVTFAATFSTLSSFIYYPAITPLAKDLHTTVEKINLTVTSYLIVSAIMPSIIGDAADMLGRRATYLVILTVYLVANIGLALQRSFTALLLLRMLQSAGVSGTFKDSYISHETDFCRDLCCCLWRHCGYCQSLGKRFVRRHRHLGVGHTIILLKPRRIVLIFDYKVALPLHALALFLAVFLPLKVGHGSSGFCPSPPLFASQLCFSFCQRLLEPSLVMAVFLLRA